MNAFDDELERSWDRAHGRGRLAKYWYMIPIGWMAYFGFIAAGGYIAYHLIKGVIR